MDLLRELPSVAVVIPNWNGVAHLPDCLNSLATLDYPADAVEVIVVDNCSTDDSLDLLASDYPWVRVVALSENLGFAGSTNAGVRAATSECVAFLNNDMHVDASWLKELVSLYAPSDGYVCVAGHILDWEGEHVDFVSGWVNFQGFAGQEHFGSPVERVAVSDRRELPFACGGSMLINRDVFLDLGGFDPTYFAFFEDVDLGWRLWLTGYKVRLAAKARSFHRHHGTASAMPLHQRQRMYERNALLTLLKNIEDAHLPAFMTAALFLLIERSLARSGSNRRAFDPGAVDQAEAELIPRTALATLHAASDALTNLEQILERRREIQHRRRRSDAEIFALFGRPFMPMTSDPGYLERTVLLRSALGIDSLFVRQRVTRLLVVAQGRFDRAAEIARTASALVPTVIASPSSGKAVSGVEVVTVRRRSELEALLAESDLVIVDGASAHAKTIRDAAAGLVVVDIDGNQRSLSAELLQRADAFFCASDTDRTNWLRVLVKLGQQLPGDYEYAPLVSVIQPTDQHECPSVLRTMIEEPWRWRERDRRRSPVAIPEDLQLLLQTWRRRYQQPGRARHPIRAVWRRLPVPLQRLVRFVLRRPLPTSRRKRGDATFGLVGRNPVPARTTRRIRRHR